MPLCAGCYRLGLLAWWLLIADRLIHRLVTAGDAETHQHHSIHVVSDLNCNHWLRSLVHVNVSG